MANPSTTAVRPISDSFSDTENEAFEDAPMMGSPTSSGNSTTYLSACANLKSSSKGNSDPSSSITYPSSSRESNKRNGDTCPGAGGGQESFWWLRMKEYEKVSSQNSSSPPEADWRLSKSSISTVYHSAQDLTDLISEISNTSDDTLQDHGSYHSIAENSDTNVPDLPVDPDDIFSSPDSPIPDRKATKSVAFQEIMALKDVDFVLAWDDKLEASSSEEAQNKRRIFEKNLEEEGLKLEREKMESSTINFVKIHAPDEVLRRYSEILKLRMPMKELNDEMIDAIYSGSPEFENLNQMTLQDQVTSTVQNGFKQFVHFFTQRFELDRRIFPKKESRLTAVYSRDKEYLFDVDAPDFFTTATRGRIVDFILSRKRYSEDTYDDFAFGIERLKRANVYTAIYPIHDGEIKVPGTPRHLLYTEWASVQKCLKYQPLDEVKDYFGVKVGLYFAWLGFYTHYLIPAAILGVLCFLYGVFTLSSNQHSNDICNANNITMCPLCNKLCDYYDISSTCFYAKLTYLFDNNATVFFAVVMSFWTAIYLEMWKRYSAEISHRWDVGDFDVNEEHPRPEYLARLKNLHYGKRRNVITGTIEPRVPFWKIRLPYNMLSLSMVGFLILLAIAAVVGVVFYRIAFVVLFSTWARDNPNIHSYSLIAVNSSAAVVNLVFIFFFNWLYSFLAEYLTEIELHRTQTQYDDALTLKMYLLQFVNYYSSIFYIAFFKGKFVGSPHKYTLFLGYRQEECAPGGCMTELCLQLAIILVGKQLLNMFTETMWPILMKAWNQSRLLNGKEFSKDAILNSQWARDYNLLEWGHNSLFGEYLEMVLQYGFVCIFVAAFPLAPLFALLNNIFEMRLDAKKLITYYRRPVSSRVRDIGIWYGIMDSVGKLAVISNAFIIAFTSNFIPKMMYKYGINHGSLDGFLEHSLAYYNTTDPAFNATRPLTTSYPDLEICRYQAYRGHFSLPDDQKYKRTQFYWQVWMARLAFIVVFENFVACSVIILRWLIPDVPSKIRERIRREAYLTNEIIIKQEMIRARGTGSAGDSTGLNPMADNVELVDRTTNSLRNRRGNGEQGDKDNGSGEVMV